MSDLKVGPEYVSYSQITTYADCGLKYKLTRLDGFHDGDAWWLWGGSAVHRASEWYDEPAPGVLEFDAAVAFNAALDEQLKGSGLTPGNVPVEGVRASRDQREEWWRANGPDMVQKYVDWREATGWRVWEDGAGQLGVEYKIDVELIPGREDTRIVAFIDRVFVTPAGELVIVDLKTGSRKPGSNLQLGFYRAALMVQEGVTADLGGYFMNRKGTVDIVGLEKYDPEHVAGFATTLRRGVEAGVFLPNVNSFCSTCGVAQHCWAQNPELKPGLTSISLNATKETTDE